MSGAFSARVPREIHKPRRYRLLAKVPLCVSFPSAVYRLDFKPVSGCPQWRLEAENLAGGPSWTLCQSGDGKEPRLLSASAYERGFEVMHPTAPSTILERLCAEGRAEVVKS